MKSTLKILMAVGLGLCILALLTPSVMSGINGTAHDLSASGPFTNVGNAPDYVCQPCHTPHNGDQTVGPPLWNHSLVTIDGTYTLYTTLVSGNTGATAGTINGSSTQVCLSCHDGTIGVDNYGGTAGGTTIGALTGGPGTGNVGKDLSDDHPVGVAYPATGDYLAAGSVTGAKIEAGFVQCGSCHDPHTTAVTKFLRVSPAANGLCGACHTK